MLDQTKRQELEKLIEEAAWLAEKKQQDEDEDMANYDMAYRNLMRALEENKLGELMMATAAAKVEEIRETCPEIIAAAEDRINQIKHTRRYGWVDGVEPLARWKLVFVGQEKIFKEDGDFKRWSWGYKIEEMSESDYSFEQHFGGRREEHAPPNCSDQLEQPVTRARICEDDCLVGGCMVVLAAVAIGPCLGL